jgi:hypothetical protein
MSEWIKCSDRKPTPEDSPILAFEPDYGFEFSALHYLDGWDGNGWYTSCEEYGMGLNEGEAFYHERRGMTHWMPLPEPPQC